MEREKVREMYTLHGRTKHVKTILDSCRMHVHTHHNH